MRYLAAGGVVMLFRLNMPKNDERGQALTESVLILPMMVLMVFGIWQLMLLQHARILVEYAGYNACRAGIVNNGDPEPMISAAAASVLPLYGDTSTFGNLMATWAKLSAMVAVGQAADHAVNAMADAVAGAVGINFANWVVSNALVDVNVLNPTDEHFLVQDLVTGNNGSEEIDFDDVLDPIHFHKNLLAAETRVMVPLKIPLINRIIWELYMIALQLEGNTRFKTTMQDQIALKTTLKEHGEDIGEQITASASVKMLAKLKLRQAQEYNQLILLKKAGAYFIPIRSTCGMQMQSNFYKRFENKGAFDVGVFED